MLCYVVLCYVMLSCVMLYNAVLWYVTLYVCVYMDTYSRLGVGTTSRFSRMEKCKDHRSNIADEAVLQ